MNSTISLSEDEAEPLPNKSNVFECVSRHQPSYLIFCAFPGLSVIINVFVLVAVLRKAQNLMRQSHVYAHVSSTLIGNVTYSLLALVQILSLYFHFGGYPNDPDPSKRGMVNERSTIWWTFRKALLCGMFVIMCGNIGLLIDSIRHNTCATLGTAVGLRFYGKEKRCKKRLMTRRRRSYVSITLLWIISLVFVAIPSLTGWNCVDVCKCLSECFPSNHNFIPTDFTCSRVSPPMANPWLSFVVMSWICGVVITIWMLKRSLRQVAKTWSRLSAAKKLEEKLDANVEESDLLEAKNIESNEKKSSVSNVSDLSLDAEVFCDERMVSNVFPEAESAIEESTSENKPISQSFSVPNNSASCHSKAAQNNRQNYLNMSRNIYVLGRVKNLYSESDFYSEMSGYSSNMTSQNSSVLHRRRSAKSRSTKASTSSFKYVIYLTVCFIVCTTPTMLLIAVDILNPTLNLNMVIINTCLTCPFVYCYLCPFILMKCLPGVKTSLSDLILRVYSTSK